MSNFDVIIIGSGAGGGACAWALSQHGVKTLVLEAGPAYDPATDYRLNQTNWEQSSFPTKKNTELNYSFGSMQSLKPEHDELRSWNHITGPMNTTTKRIGWKYHHVQGVGGSTLHFTGEAHRMNPLSMKMYSQYGVAADWPLSYEELEPYYEVAEKQVGVAGNSNEITRPRRIPLPLPAHEYSYANKKISESGQKIGLNWSANSLAVLSQPYDGRPSCNYCNNCNRGCPRSDKGSVDVTFIRKAQASGHCTVKSHTQVIAIHAGSNDLIQSIDYIDKHGKTISIKAQIIVVSCGAVETPRLLLRSKNNYAPNGLGNESGHVGKHLMETISWLSTGLHPEPLASYRGLPSDMICWDYNSPEAIPGVIGGCRFAPATSEANLVGPINYAQRVVSGWGYEHKKQMRNIFGHALSVGSIGESLPNENSYIDLDPDKRDRQGLPTARINTHITKEDIKRLKFMAGMTKKILNAAGVNETIEEYGSYDYFNSTHIFGTARMGEKPGDSVVNQYCRSHKWKNLYIVDSSVFPSSGGGESPSLTIEALAIRTAEHIRGVLIKRNI